MIERLIYSLERDYYGPAVTALFEIIAVITALAYSKPERLRSLFIAYIAFDFCALIIEYYLEIVPVFTPKEVDQGYNFLNTMVAYIELLTYGYFFRKVIKNKFVKGYISIATIAFSCIIGVFILTGFDFLHISHSRIAFSIGTLEFGILLVPCLTYFYELMSLDTGKDFFSQPSFWIVSGIFVYSTISIPFYLIIRFLFVNDLEQSQVLTFFFYYLPFAINFIFLTKAFSMRTSLSS